MDSISSTHHIFIRPNRAWVRVDWKALWAYRDLLFLLVRRDFIAKYRQTILGPLWGLVQPLLMTVVFTLVFNRVAKVPTDGVPSMLFYMSGLLVWNFFSQAVNASSATLVRNANLYGKVYFPRLIVPVALVVSNIFSFLIQALLFLGFFIYFRAKGAPGFGVNADIALFPLVLLQVLALSLGVGLWMSALTAKYRDLTQMTTFLLQIWMYASPVIYPLSLLPDKYRIYSQINPMTTPVEITKHMLLGAGSFDVAQWAISAATTLVILLTGLMIFQRTERSFVDTV